MPVPSHAPPAVDSSFGRLVDDLISRMQAGAAIDWSAVERDHPDHAAGLRAVRPALGAVAELSRSGGPSLAGVAAGTDAADGLITGVLGDFRIFREVGRGGMGIVYEAEQVSLGRRVALKVLPYAATMDPRQLQRFKNESRAAASLRHEHIVHVYGVGCERGVHYYAMEFIDGLTLAQVIAGMRRADPKKPSDETAAYAPAAGAVPSVAGPSEAGPHAMQGDVDLGSMTPATEEVAALTTRLSGPTRRDFYRTAAALIAGAADALEHAHALGIVHRDVKPGNLLVDAAGKVYVADFGLARLGSDAGLTMSGDLLGTLRYMAPEQAMSRHGLVDHRADVYALGCTLYELLTGRPAVDATDRAEILRQIAFEEPAPLRKLHRSIPTELETIALKCLAKNPAERYGTAGELADDLRRWLADQTIRAKPPTLVQRTSKWARRHKYLVRSAVALLLVSVGALALSTWLIGRERNVARDERRRAQIAYGEARQALDELFSQVVEDWLSKQTELTPEHRAFLERALGHYQRFAAETGDSEETRAAVAGAHQRVAYIRLQLWDFEGSAEASSRCVALYERLVADYPGRPVYRMRLAECCAALGDRYQALGRPAEAEQPYRRAVSLMEGLTAEFPADTAYRESADTAQSNFASLLARLAHPGAEKTLRDQVARWERLVEQSPAAAENRTSLAMSYNGLGTFLMGSRRYEEAERVFRRALAAWDDVPAASRAKPHTLENMCWTFLNMGRLLNDALRRPAEAEPYYREFVAHADKLDKLSTRRRRDLAMVLGDQGNILSELGRREEAERCFRRSVTVLEKLAADAPAASPHLTALASKHHQLGVFLKESGRLKDAESSLRRAVELCEKVRSTDKPTPATLRESAVYHVKLAEALYLAGLPREAEPVFRKALTLAEQLVNGDSQYLGILAIMLARCNDPQFWDASRAVTTCRRAVELHPKSVHQWTTLGVAHYRAGAIREAEDAFVKAMEFSPDWGEDWFYLAMAHWHRGAKDQARERYGKAVEWMRKNRPGDPEQLRLRGEAEAMLGIPAAAGENRPTPPKD